MAFAGPKNKTGAPGKDGRDGARGPAGPKGDQGERGPRGERGPKGEDGITRVIYSGGFGVGDSSDTPLNPSQDNFSFKTIGENTLVQIPTGQEMVLVSPLEVGGGLDINGSVEFIDESKNDEGLSWTKIPSGKSITVPRDRVMIVPNHFDVDGDLNIYGALEAIA